MKSKINKDKIKEDFHKKAELAKPVINRELKM